MVCSIGKGLIKDLRALEISKSLIFDFHDNVNAYFLGICYIKYRLWKEGKARILFTKGKLSIEEFFLLTEEDRNTEIAMTCNITVEEFLSNKFTLYPYTLSEYKPLALISSNDEPIICNCIKCRRTQK